eukprot:538472_1
MTAPQRTTFEVTVSNRLEYNATYIQVQAELQYATELSSSLDHKNSIKTRQESGFEDSESKSDANKTQNKLSSGKSIALSQSQSSAISDSQSSANSQSTEASVSGGYGPVSASVSAKHSSTQGQSSSSSNSNSQSASNSKSQFQSTDNLRDNKASRAIQKKKIKYIIK